MKDEQPNDLFKIVAIAEDFGAVIRAEKLSEWLATELKPWAITHSTAWKFETLGTPHAAKQAAPEAADADLIIFAASGTTEPPRHIKNWMKQWLPKKKGGVTALVALLNQEDQAAHQTSPLCDYLRRLAGEGGMDFISNSGAAQSLPIFETSQ